MNTNSKVCINSLYKLRENTKKILANDYNNIIAKYKKELQDKSKNLDLLDTLNILLQGEYKNRPEYEQAYLICAFLELFNI